MNQKAKLQHDYSVLKERLVYNQLYALKYPVEDMTTLEREFTAIRELITGLKSREPNEHSRNQLELAAQRIQNAFNLFRDGKDGFREIEEALDYVESSKVKSPPKATFIVGPDGIVRPL